jgi:hypothetical protein
MAYCIFIKSLRILEEFRKNPCVKISPKSPCANFQSLGKFKIPIFISKRISLQFQPSHPAGLSDLSAQMALLAQLGPATHPSLTSSRNQRRHRPDLMPPRLHHPGRHGRPSSRCQSPPPLLLYSLAITPPLQVTP